MSVADAAEAAAEAVDVSPLAVKAHQVKAHQDASDVSVAGGPVLVVLDWDDTLLPTSWLVHENVLPMRQPMASLDTVAQRWGPQEEAKLREVRGAVAALLDACEALVEQMGGRVVLITSSVPGWVPSSAAAFLGQSLTERLARYAVFARRKGAPPGPVRWKSHALQELANRSFSTVLSIGDGAEERAACLALAGPTGVRSVKLADFPSPRDLAAQLHHVADLLPCIATDTRRATDLHMVRAQRNSWKVMVREAPAPARTLWDRLKPARVLHFFARARRASK
jgi:hypothetical protein